MQEGKVETHAYALNGKVRLHVVDGNDVVEMEADAAVAQHLIDSLRLAIKAVEAKKFEQ